MSFDGRRLVGERLLARCLCSHEWEDRQKSSKKHQRIHYNLSTRFSKSELWLSRSTGWVECECESLREKEINAT